MDEGVRIYKNLADSKGADESDSIIIGHRFYCSSHLIYLMIHLDRPVCRHVILPSRPKPSHTDIVKRHLQVAKMREEVWFVKRIWSCGQLICSWPLFLFFRITIRAGSSFIVIVSWPVYPNYNENDHKIVIYIIFFKC